MKMMSAAEVFALVDNTALDLQGQKSGGLWSRCGFLYLFFWIGGEELEILDTKKQRY